MRTFNLNLAILVFLLAGNASTGIAQLSGTFTPTRDMSVPRAFHTATLLANGKVLIVGGVGITRSGDTQPLMTAELYDPYTCLCRHAEWRRFGARSAPALERTKPSREDPFRDVHGTQMEV
jgi:hypothetical protein